MAASLAISARYHDSAARFVVDGDIVAVAPEERFTRIKHALDYCLMEAGLTLEQLGCTGFYGFVVLRPEAAQRPRRNRGRT